MSIERPSDTASRTIIDISPEKNGVTIVFPLEKFSLSLSDYSDGFYYPGKKLSKEEFQRLKACSKEKSAKDYIALLLQKHRYTIQGAKEKIRHRFPSFPEEKINSFLVPYQEAGVLDDLSYAEDFATLKSEGGYGENYIVSELKKRGIPESILREKKIISQFEKSAAALPLLVEKKDRLLRQNTMEKRKEVIQAFLIRRGYPLSIAREAIRLYYLNRGEAEKEEDQNLRSVLLKKEAQKCYNAIVRKTIDSHKKKGLFFQKMKMKGFRYDEIESIAEREGYSFHD